MWSLLVPCCGPSFEWGMRMQGVWGPIRVPSRLPCPMRHPASGTTQPSSGISLTTSLALPLWACTSLAAHAGGGAWRSHTAAVAHPQHRQAVIEVGGTKLLPTGLNPDPNTSISVCLGEL